MTAATTASHPESELDLEEKSRILKEQFQPILDRKSPDCNWPMKLLYDSLNLIIGKERKLTTLRSLELYAIVPPIVQALFNSNPFLVRDSIKPFSEISTKLAPEDESRNHEIAHFLLLDGLIKKENVKESYIKDRLLPLLFTVLYFIFSCLLYLVSEKLFLIIHADGEGCVEYSYAQFLKQNPQYETDYDVEFAKDFGAFKSVADVFKAVAIQERGHREKSLEMVSQLRRN